MQNIRENCLRCQTMLVSAVKVRAGVVADQDDQVVRESQSAAVQPRGWSARAHGRRRVRVQDAHWPGQPDLRPARHVRHGSGRSVPGQSRFAPFTRAVVDVRSTIRLLWMRFVSGVVRSRAESGSDLLQWVSLRSRFSDACSDHSSAVCDSSCCRRTNTSQIAKVSCLLFTV